MTENDLSAAERLDALLAEGKVSQEEYDRLNIAMETGDSPATEIGASGHDAPKKQALRRSWQDRQILGVCGGLAAYFDVSATWIRIAFAVGALVSCGTALAVYLILALAMPWDAESIPKSVMQVHAGIQLGLALLVLAAIHTTAAIIVSTEAIRTWEQMDAALSAAAQWMLLVVQHARAWGALQLGVIVLAAVARALAPADGPPRHWARLLAWALAGVWLLHAVVFWVFQAWLFYTV